MTLSGKTRLAFLIFFASHIPITLMVDGQAFFPRSWYPQALIDVVDWYAATFKDKLMSYPRETWFTSMISIEIFFQLPFFFVAVYTLLQQNQPQPSHQAKDDKSSDNDGKTKNETHANNNNEYNAKNATLTPTSVSPYTKISGKGHFRSLCLIYGASTATTLVPILSCVAFDPDTTLTEKGILLGFYLPYLIFPVWLVWIAFWNEDVFADAVVGGGESTGKDKAKVF